MLKLNCFQVFFLKNIFFLFKFTKFICFHSSCSDKNRMIRLKIFICDSVFWSILALTLTSNEKEKDVRYLVDVVQLLKDTNFKKDCFRQDIKFLPNSEEPKEYIIKLTVICINTNIVAALWPHNVWCKKPSVYYVFGNELFHSPTIQFNVVGSPCPA